MRKDIEIGDLTIGFKATAATPIRYRTAFHKDFFKALMSFEKKEDYSDVVNSAQEIAYVMAMADTGVAPTDCTEESYFEWLDRIEDPEAFLDKLSEIMSVYYGNSEEESAPKEEADPQNER